MSKNVAVIFAGGSGERMGSGIPKQFIEVSGKPIIVHTLELFEEHPLIDVIYIACKKDYIPKLERLVRLFMITKVKKVVEGGATGQDSIYNGLTAAYEDEGADNLVLIHDGVRPCVTPETISSNILLAREKGSAVTCSKFYETPVFSENGDVVGESLDRNKFFTAQAPQTFFLGEVINAHKTIRKENPEYNGIVDTCTLMKSKGKTIYMVEGNRGNIKVTTPEDLYVFRGMLEYRENQQALGLSQKDITENLQR